MNPAVAWRPVVAVAILLSGACLGFYSRAVEETRAGLLGLTGKDLRACLGVPSDFAIDGDVEQQIYRYEHDDEPDAGFGAAGAGGATTRGVPEERDYEPRGLPHDELDSSYCELDFELTSGRVTRVSAQSRTREGMNADASCLLRAQPCLPYGDEEGIGATE